MSMQDGYDPKGVEKAGSAAIKPIQGVLKFFAKRSQEKASRSAHFQNSLEMHRQMSEIDVERERQLTNIRTGAAKDIMTHAQGSGHSKYQTKLGTVDIKGEVGENFPSAKNPGRGFEQPAKSASKKPATRASKATGAVKSAAKEVGSAIGQEVKEQAKTVGKQAVKTAATAATKRVAKPKTAAPKQAAPKQIKGK